MSTKVLPYSSDNELLNVPKPEVFNPFWFRFFEILPGACVWTALFLPFILSIYYPLIVSVFILMFDVYWLMNALSYAKTLILGYCRLRSSMKTNWTQKLVELDQLSAKELADKKYINWHDVYQTIILTTYKEDISILEAGLDSIIEADYPKDHLIFVLATEARAGQHADNIGDALKQKYGHYFYKFIVTKHPDGIINEVKAKGSNATYAAKILVNELSQTDIQLENVIVSTSDADSRFEKEYFSCLTYKYVTTPDRLQCGYQPVIMFNNNIWESPMVSRVLAFGTTFWQLIQSVRDYRLVTFATHAMSLKTLVEMDFWCRTIVNEDSRQFYRAFFHYNGKFRSIPLFMPVYMDAVHVGNIKGTLRNLYLQQQRWAYGVEHFPYIVMASLKNGKIRWLDRVALIWRTWQGAFSWSTTSFFITVVGWLPIALNNSFRDQVIASNFPIVTKFLLSLTWIGLVVSSTTTLLLLPKRPEDKNLGHFFTMILQWILVPVTTLLFGALPGIDAQTRLMLGKHLGFTITEKKALNSNKIS